VYKHPDAVALGALSFSTHSKEDNGSVGIKASGEDGWSKVSFTPKQATTYNIQFDIEGTTEEGDTIERQVIGGVLVVEKELNDIRSVAFDLVNDEIEMTTSLNLFESFSPTENETYMIYAEVVDSTGKEIMTASGLADLEANNVLKLNIQTDWLEATSGGYSIAYMRISNPQGTVPLVIRERVAVESSLPVPFLIKNRRLGETNEERNFRMTRGVRPEQEAALGNLRKLGSGSGILLSHGYCSGSNPWNSDLVSKATNAGIAYARLEDYDQNRDHEAFALLLHSLGQNNFASCGIIAHSQGGAAALHLYTRYWSCVDYGTTGSRLIQSVGTPYQGTALAGSVALIGSIFGAGCGTNYEMTYSGARAWLSNIPDWARKEVHYWTTSFTDKWWRYDYCHIATDLLLSDPDDGCTEKSKGQLPGGINHGHKTGECHTSDMRDMSQVNDSGRNSEMVVNARR
jgi:pimeloyl-ACP methyl ester carboxylesterase